MHHAVHSHLALTPIEPGPLAAAGGSDPYATELVKLESAGSWADAAPGTDIQVLVTEGTLDWDSRALQRGSYLRMTWAQGDALGSVQGCRLLIKSSPGKPAASPTVVVDPADAPWSPGHGNLRVLPLDSRGHESTALVHWPAGEHFLFHRHFGGEEIFVLSGTFQDEHGSYPAGSWIQSPHGSVHDPFVDQETLIWVKTGHLPPTSKA